MALVGSPLRRKEDPRLLRGQASFLADVRLPGMWHAAVLRSPHARARIVSVDAGGLPAPAALLTAADLAGRPHIPVRTCGTPRLDGFLQPLLPRREVRYAGQPVAVVAAPSRQLAEDALEQVRVAYEPLPPCVDTLAAPPADSLRFARGDAAAAFAAARAVVSARFRTGRHTGVPLETRGVVAAWRGDRLTVWGQTKTAYANRALLASVLGIDADRVRLVEGDVGGGFGVRGEPYPEDLLVPWLARRLGRPLGWIEDRAEHLRSINHSREMVCDAALALAADGAFLALRAEIRYDGGAYARPHGMLLPEYTAALLPGPYRIPALDIAAHLVLTHKVPVGTYRGPGGFESCFVRERLVDLAARRMGLDPAELRLRNLLRPEELPYDTGLRPQGQPLVYEGGDYPACLRQVVARLGGDGGAPPGDGDGGDGGVGGDRGDGSHGAERGDALGMDGSDRGDGADGRYGGRRGRIGTGLACLVEKSADPQWEYARVQVHASGRVTVYTGSSGVGQGVETALAQICGDCLGVPYDAVEVVHGDTDRIPYGIGSFASRSTILAGNAVREAALEVRARALAAAAARLEARAEDLELRDGVVAPRGAPARAVALGALAALCSPPSGTGLQAEATYRAAGLAVGFGCHAASVRVDPDTGQTEALRYIVGHDVGRAVNPALVRGQIAGAVAQAMGGTLLEELRYDAGGQLSAGSLSDYLLPTACDVPRVECLIWENACRGNPLGVKGAGESGIPGPPAAIGNAVADALAEGTVPLVTQLPLTPERLTAAQGRLGDGAAEGRGGG